MRALISCERIEDKERNLRFLRLGDGGTHDVATCVKLLESLGKS